MMRFAKLLLENRRAAGAAWAALFALFLAHAALGQDAAKTAAEAALKAAAGEEAESPRPKSPGPPDGKWLVDKATGARYFVHKIQKGKEGLDHIWLDETHIQVRYGLQFEVVDHDDTTFSVKIFERPKLPRQQIAKAEPSDEELAAAAATYGLSIESVDQIQLERFDRGLPRTGQWRNGFDVADMNGDGHLDIVHGPARKGRATLHIFLGDGKGTWRHWDGLRLPEFPYDYGDVKAADFNGDGHQDLALGMHLKGLMVIVGDGQGGFTRWSEGIEVEVPGKGGDASTFSSRALGVADWNGDERPDLISYGEGPKGLHLVKTGVLGNINAESRGALIYLNQGNGTWKPLPPSVKTRNFGDDVEVGDFNGDGRVDFASAIHVTGHRHLLAFGAEDGGWEEQEVDVLRPKAYVPAVAVGELGADGRDGLVVGFTSRELGVWRTGIDILTSDGEGWDRQPVFATDGQAGVYALDVGDLDGDGDPDIVALSGTGETWIFLGTEDGGFAREEARELPAYGVGCNGYAVRLVDLDGDGRDELVAAFSGEQSGYPGVIGEKGCPGKGNLTAWRVADSTARSAAGAP